MNNPIDDLKNTAEEMAYIIRQLTPISREQSLALTKLEECLLWAQAGFSKVDEVRKRREEV